MNQAEARAIQKAVKKLCLQMGQGICPSIQEIKEVIEMMKDYPEMEEGRRDLEQVMAALSRIDGNNVEFSTLETTAEEIR